MDVFPAELFQKIIDEVSSTADLCTLRTVNKAFNELTTSRAFQTVVIIDTAKSVERLRQIKHCANLRCHVKEIHFLYDKLDTNGDNLKDAIEVCFSEVEELSSLATLRLTFDRFNKTYPQNSLALIRQFQIQRSFLKALRSSVRSLVLVNFRPFPRDDSITLESFQKILGSLSNLSISTVTSAYNYLDPHFIRDFWAVDIPTHFLSPAQSSLTSLTLHSASMMDFHSDYHLEFPHLAFISLSRLVFVLRAEDEDDFISRQRNLTRIELRGCGVPYNSASGVWWSHIWKRIGDNLKYLEYLEVDFTQDPDIYMGYVNHRGGMVDILQEDNASLQALQAAIYSRRASRID